MNRFLHSCIITLHLLFGYSLFGQGGDEKFSRATFKGNMTNVDVIDAKRWHHQGKIDQSLKKGLEIASSNIELTSIDSFNTYQILAYNFRLIGADGLALEHAKKAIGIMQHIAPNDDSKITWVASYFSAVKQYDAAIIFMKKNSILLQNEKDTLALLKLYNDIGFTYHLNNQPDSAIAYYNKVIDFKSDEDQYKSIVGLSKGNLGVVYLAKGDYENALINMQIDADLNEDRNKTSYYNALNGIGECYFLMKKYNAAKNTLLTLITLNHQENKTNLKTYKLLADVYEKTGNGDKSALFLRKYITLKDSLQKSEIPIETIFKQLSDAKISGIKKDLELAENKAKSNELKKQIYLITILLSIVLFIISIAYFRNRQKKKVKIQKLETELIKAELKNKKKDLTNVVTNLSYKRKFIDEVQEKLKNLQNQPETKINEHITLLIREFNSYKNADKNIAVLQADIDKVNISFFEKLGKKFPLLTENEKELCGLLLLKLTTKDIASIRNVSNDAIKKARQRIRKKLPISENQELITFLENV